MIAKSIYETPVRWPEKSAGVLRHCGQIARLPIIYKDAGQALIFLDFLFLLFAYQLILFELMCRFARQHQGKRIFESQLIALAENSNGEAKYGAQNILSFVYGENYCDCISPIEGGHKSSQSSFSYDQEDLASAMGLSISAKPNPASVYVSLDYTLPIGIEQATLQIINVEGKTIYSTILQNTQGQLSLDISNYKRGAYIYKIVAGDYSISESLIIQ